jgi:hypothetical protein
MPGVIHPGGGVIRGDLKKRKFLYAKPRQVHRAEGNGGGGGRFAARLRVARGAVIWLALARVYAELRRAIAFTAVCAGSYRWIVRRSLL